MATAKFTAKPPTDFVVVYTKEPWTFMSEDPRRVTINVPLETPWYSDAFEGGEQEAEAVGNAYRIVACVNACAGLPDPEKNIRELVAALSFAVLKLTENGLVPIDQSIIDAVKPFCLNPSEENTKGEESQ